MAGGEGVASERCGVERAGGDQLGVGRSGEGRGTIIVSLMAVSNLKAYSNGENELVLCPKGMAAVECYERRPRGAAGVCACAKFVAAQRLRIGKAGEVHDCRRSACPSRSAAASVRVQPYSVCRAGSWRTRKVNVVLAARVSQPSAAAPIAMSMGRSRQRKCPYERTLYHHANTRVGPKPVAPTAPTLQGSCS